MGWLGTAFTIASTGYSYYRDQKATSNMIDNMKPVTDESLRAVNRSVANSKAFARSQEASTSIDDDIYLNDLINTLSTNVSAGADATIGMSNMQYSAGAQSKFNDGVSSANVGFGRAASNVVQDREQRTQSLLQQMYDADRTRNTIIGDAARAGYTTAGINVPSAT